MLEAPKRRSGGGGSMAGSGASGGSGTGLLEAGLEALMSGGLV